MAECPKGHYYASEGHTCPVCYGSGDSAVRPNPVPRCAVCGEPDTLHPPRIVRLDGSVESGHRFQPPTGLEPRGCPTPGACSCRCQYCDVVAVLCMHHGGHDSCAVEIAALRAQLKELQREHDKCPEWSERIVDAARRATEWALEREQLSAQLVATEARLHANVGALRDEARHHGVAEIGLAEAQALLRKLVAEATGPVMYADSFVVLVERATWEAVQRAAKGK